MTIKSEVDNRVGIECMAKANCSPLVKGIVRKLVAQAGEETGYQRPPVSLNDKTQKVIFDTEVDGIRCLLMRPDNPASLQVALSPREQEIARMIAKGYPNKTIASVLEISSWTVGTHLRRMFAKVGVNSRAALVAQLATTIFLQREQKDSGKLGGRSENRI
jgi:DNA-binding CsgD family transcriptional regulator